MPRRSSSPTMKDIAARANVSIGTVSRVLNRHEDVDEKLRDRVETVVRKLGYRLNSRTRSVVHTKSRIIGLVLCNDFGLSSAQSLLLLGIEEYCAQAGYYLLFARHQFSPELSAQNIQIPSVIETPGLADCVIIAGTVYRNILTAFAKHGFRYVLLGNHVVDPGENGLHSSRVQYNDESGCHEATRYLAQLGHTHIWYIGDAELGQIARRFITPGFIVVLHATAVEPVFAGIHDVIPQKHVAEPMFRERGQDIAVDSARDDDAIGQTGRFDHAWDLNILRA